MALNILIIALLMVLAPLLARGISRWVSIPVVVFELVLGIMAGPGGFGWVQESEILDLLSNFGLAVLFFMAGSEIDFVKLKGRPLNRSLLGWLVSLALGVAVGFLVAPEGGALFIAIALSSTALGTLLPIIRDAGELNTPFGRTVSALGAVGEFGPLVAISIFLGARAPGPSSLVLLFFVLVAGAGILIALRAPHGRLHRFVRASLHTSGQFAIRVVVMILAALVALSIALGLDMLLGAFAAGVMWRLIMREAPLEDREQVESKLEGVAFGFFVPIFFVATGIGFDLRALIADPLLLVLVGVFLLVFLLTRGIPAQWAVPKGSSLRDRAAIGLMAATGLPIIVATTNIGVQDGALSSGLASALVGAGMMSVLLYPLIGMMLHRSANRSRAGDQQQPE